MQKNKMKWTKICSRALTVLGILTLLYCLYAIIVSCSYIGDLMSTGQLEAQGSVGKIFQYIMTQSFSYLFYGIVFLVLGYRLANQEGIVDTVNQGHTVRNVYITK